MVKTGYKSKNNFFTSREIQISIALLVVLSLLGGVFLQSLSSVLSSYLGLSPTALSIFLIVGYLFIIVFIALLFSHRFVGPFSRLEYEMKMISKGDLGRRLSIKSKDDLHVRKFVTSINECIADFEKMSMEYNKISSLISSQLGEIIESMDRDPDDDCEKTKEKLKELQRYIHEFRERW